MKYRKKPVEIEAVQHKGSSTHKNAIENWMKTGEYDEPSVTTSDIRSFNIITLEGVMKVSVGDYVIKGVDGEFYPCKPSIFEKTYDKV